MAETEREGVCCGGGAVHGGARARDPFALPGTERRYSRDRVVDVRHIRLEVAVDLEKRSIRGVARHTVAALNDDTRVVTFDAAEMTIEGVTGPGGKALSFDHVDDRLTVRLASPAAAGAAFDVAIAYRATPRRGLYFTAPDDGYPDKPLQAWTQGQDEDSRYWFPCFDYPNEKATTEVVVTVASRFQTLSNGALVEKKPGSEKGTTTWHWKMAIPHVSYLVTLVVGEFDEVALPSRRVPMPVLVPKGRAKDVERCFGRTPAMVEHFSERFGVDYPYEKYAQVVVADFIFGGMENTTATTLTEYALYDARAALDYDADDLVAHELAHQWWGDLLTCRDWSHAWLNEGFATWSESVSREKLMGEDEARWHVVLYARAYFAEDGGEYRRPIVCKTYDDPIEIFDRHLYQKGGCVLNMLRGELGEESFWRSIQAYANANREKSVVTDDLRRAIEETTGRNFEWFFDQWVYGAGHPAIKASWSWDEKAKVAAITVNQTHPAAENTAEAFRGTLAVEIVAGTERRRLKLDVVKREHTFHVPLAARPDGVRFDPDGRWLAAWSIDVGLDEQRKTLASDPSMVVRLRAAAALAKDVSPETVQALARCLAGDAFWGVRTEAAASLAEIRTPAAREALLAALPKATHPKARRAIVAALGAFRGDEAAGDALRERLERGDESMFVEAEAADALGRTRTPGAREAIESALRTRDSWADTVRTGCVRGLGHTASPEALPTLERRLEWGNHPRVRGASALATAAIGSRLVQRDAIRERLEAAIDDRDFRVQMAAIFALRVLGDERAISALRRASEQATDGRVRRACRVAARRLERGNERTTEVARLSDALETLRKQAGEQWVRLQRLEAQVAPPASAAGASPAAGKAAGAKRARKASPPAKKKKRGD